MKKKTATQSAFFNPRVLVGFAISVIAAFIALFAMAHQNDVQPTQNRSNLAASLTAAAIADDEETNAVFVPGVDAPIGVRPNVPNAIFVVNTTADTQDVAAGNGVCADSNGNCSLRAAITEA